MKHTPIVAASVALLLFGVTSAIAQPKPGQTAAQPAASAAGLSATSPGDAQAAQAVRLVKLLGLSATQKSKWFAIVQASRTKGLAELQNDPTATAAQVQAKIADIRKSALTQLRAILTPAQQKKLDKIQANNQAAAVPRSHA